MVRVLDPNNLGFHFRQKSTSPEAQIYRPPYLKRFLSTSRNIWKCAPLYNPVKSADSTLHVMDQL